MAANARKSALVTGASRGLGLALSRHLALRGYRLVVTARGPEPLTEAARELSRITDVVALPGDVTDPDHRARLAAAVGDDLDLLVNNASDLGETPLPLLSDYDLGRLRNVLETNVVAPLALTQLLLPALHKAGGRVINVSSDAARGAYPGWGGYGASKAALDLLSMTMGKELDGIAVIAVDPGDMRTDMHQAAHPGEDISDLPLPEDTLPFWTWLLEQSPQLVTGRRFEAQAAVWELAG